MHIGSNLTAKKICELYSFTKKVSRSANKRVSNTIDGPWWSPLVYILPSLFVSLGNLLINNIPENQWY